MSIFPFSPEAEHFGVKAKRNIFVALDLSVVYQKRYVHPTQ